MALPFDSTCGRRRITGLRFVLGAFTATFLVYWTTSQQNNILPLLKPMHERLSNGNLILSENTNIPDARNFELLINADVCDKSDVFLLIFVHSAVSHIGHRNTIRSTWGSPSSLLPHLKTVFLLAKPLNKRHQRPLLKEANKYNDIVQGNFIDSYRNLTYKHIMGLQWVAEQCAKAKFVMKMDDDIFVDIFQLVSLLRKQISSIGKYIACYHQHQMPVVRDPQSKWFVSTEEFPLNTFDDYCSGWAYVTNPMTAKVLSATASRMPYFWVDDVHITGTAAQKANVTRIKLNRYFSLETQSLLEWTQSKTAKLWNKIFAPTWGDLNLMKVAHHKAHACANANCTCCFEPVTQKPEVPKTQVPTGRSFVKPLPLQ